ncbi:hypothetical protein L9F63_015046, partial [Diploptera punctata]
MTLPVSTYEELLARVRSLTHETIQLQRELTTPLVDHNENERSLITPSCYTVISTPLEQHLLRVVHQSDCSFGAISPSS